MIHVEETDPVGEVDLSFPYRDVVIKRGVDAKEFYDMHTEIGRGKFGTVYRCREKTSSLELAAKFIPVARKEDRRNVEREVDIMRKLQHPRLIQLYDAFDCGKIMVVVLELIEGGELFERVIDDDFVLTEKACTAFMRQICEGIGYIHKQNILHLDMKPENILCLTKTGNRIKIIDFGLARKYDPDKKLQVLFGTPEFVAPEVVNFDQIGFGTDMWSVGVICYVLLSGLSPFMGETDVETMANVTIAKYDFDDDVFDEISSDAKDFITKLLLKDKKQRMTAAECLEHSWLRRKPPAAAPPLPSALGLDVAKDNLRLFVERWAEHPNSPYLFDVSAHVISPLLLTAGVQLTSSQHSLRGMSPSPCGSLTSSPDSVLEHDAYVTSSTPPDDSVFSHYTFNPPPVTRVNELQSFERRASDSSFVVRKNDIAERINLAEEIRKLSDKLFKMSTLSDFSSLPNGTSTILSPAPQPAPVPSFKSSPVQRPAPSIMVQEPPTSNTSSSTSSSTNVPWRRTKFRMTGMNRDVPLNSYSKSSSFTETENGIAKSQVSEKVSSSTSNAVGTKDLLLKLLDRWDGVQEPSRTPTGRHKSISAEWSEVENLGQRTISSLNTFFQSRATNKKSHPFMAANGVK